MKKNIQLLSFLAFLLGLSILNSCGDCYQEINGVIVDKDTNMPIDSVFIQDNKKEFNNVYSDKEGLFELHGVSGGLFKCPPMTVKISKIGYDTISLDIESSVRDTIKLRKMNNRQEK